MDAQFGPEIENTPRLKERAHFFPWGLAGYNAHGPEDSTKYYTLDALMQLNGGPLSLPVRLTGTNLRRESRPQFHRCAQDRH